MESKAALKVRLISEGRWEAFKTRREELKAQGIEPAKAWEITKNEFQPIKHEDQSKLETVSNPVVAAYTAGGNGNGGGLVPGKADSAVLPKTKRTSITKDFEWVYWHIGNADIKPEDAPSSSAWWMLQKVRGNPTVQIEFIRTLLQRLRPDKNESETERFYDDGRVQINLIARVRTASQNSVLPSGS
jgi:hypothetical protein